MPLTLFYITNKPEVALIAEQCGVDRVWIDLETLGKEERQPYNTVKSHHSVEDIARIAPQLTKAEMMVRVNPWNRRSAQEIDAVIAAGAEIIMLPMWRSAKEVKKFLDAVGGRVRTSLLLETKEAMECIDEVLQLDFDEIHIGLNDLHLSCGKLFMFEQLADGTVEALCEKFKAKGIPYGFGGIARLGKGMLPSEKVIMEHYRLGSTRAILSRSFCNVDECTDLQEIHTLFETGMRDVREYEAKCTQADAAAFRTNQQDVARSVRKIVATLEEKRRYET